MSDTTLHKLRVALADPLHDLGPSRRHLILALLDEAERELAEAKRWIPVSERLPADQQEVRFVPLSGNAMNGWFSVRGDGVSAQGAFIRGDGLTRSRGAAWYCPSAVTHWMPLPEPPK